jgi:hypothetical protein
MSVRLAVLVDGAPLAEEDARAFWKRFSAYLEEHRGDLAGFAKAEGFASVHPETRGGVPTLVASRTEGQRPYANAPNRKEGGGGGRGKPKKKKR